MWDGSVNLGGGILLSLSQTIPLGFPFKPLKVDLPSGVNVPASPSPPVQFLIRAGIPSHGCGAEPVAKLITILI